MRLKLDLQLSPEDAPLLTIIGKAIKWIVLLAIAAVSGWLYSAKVPTSSSWSIRDKTAFEEQSAIVLEGEQELAAAPTMVCSDSETTTASLRWTAGELNHLTRIIQRCGEHLVHKRCAVCATQDVVVSLKLPGVIYSRVSP